MAANNSSCLCMLTLLLNPRDEVPSRDCPGPQLWPKACSKRKLGLLNLDLRKTHNFGSPPLGTLSFHATLLEKAARWGTVRHQIRVKEPPQMPSHDQSMNATARDTPGDPSRRAIHLGPRSPKESWEIIRYLLLKARKFGGDVLHRALPWVSHSFCMKKNKTRSLPSGNWPTQSQKEQ